MHNNYMTTTIYQCGGAVMKDVVMQGAYHAVIFDFVANDPRSLDTIT